MATPPEEQTDFITDDANAHLSSEERARRKHAHFGENQVDHRPADTPPAEAAPARPRSRRTFWIVVLVAVAVFALLLLIGLLPRLKQNNERKEEAQGGANATPTVSVLPAEQAPDTIRLDLPADTRSNRETYLFARTNGFVQAWYTDIGTEVKRGQLLALIATPELDQQIAQARANLTLAQSNYRRLTGISMPGAISKQELDQAKAQFSAEQAVVNGLLAQQGFRRVVAPFSGLVTQRNVEVGSLVSPSNAAGSQLFKVEQTDTLRAFVNVPQNYATAIRPGLITQLIVPEFPNRTFAGRVARDAGALSEGTRTLETIVKISNREQQLRPGIFAQVRFELPRTAPSVLISANTLVPGGTQPRVVVIQDEKVHYQDITPGRDFGAQVEVIGGLKGGELLVVNPAETLTEGETVAARRAKVEKKAAAPTQPAAPERLYDPNRPIVSSPAGK
ncbi:efflux RND transporter periplasmic adaptor subunit [Hymenobacter defluvii]|uniref:Efflux RND transporter periplasmic adaptor subunit n=1 Tax=Hymenobacter defluvii TaxID=2054411 RepID=A0ABS3TCJ1_9BACT|nr:efflux RND transporter periplasmic adaptor subunit [Hymenobacter defluvii]MBO3270480.1 efflux RND transporter periplasmic adaptor subunit [Hymenobacter defluvii]